MILNYNKEHWLDLGGFDTANEINQQPDTWKATFELIESRKEEIAEFIAPFLNNKGDIILTGAGTSAFVGNTAETSLLKSTGSNVRAIATTDLTTNPELYLNADRETLLVSFARSGNSPESVATVQHVNKLFPNTKHIFITCNIDGALSKMGTEGGRNLSVVLDERTNDKSLAMTSSFSNMYLAVLLIFNIAKLDEIKSNVEQTIKLGEQASSTVFTEVEKLVADYDFNRVVFLGSDALKGIAQESALKMLELTAGKVTTMFETPLGFRHGPKSVVNDETLVMLYLSDDAYTRKYELDLLNEVANLDLDCKVVVVSNSHVELPENVLSISLEQEAMGSQYLALPYVIIGQSLGVLKSCAVGNKPDTPSPTGQINRVVEGVTIYPL